MKFHIPNPLRLQSMRDAVNMFLIAISIPYLNLILQFVFLHPVPLSTWWDFAKFHYGARVSASANTASPLLWKELAPV